MTYDDARAAMLRKSLVRYEQHPIYEIAALREIPKRSLNANARMTIRYDDGSDTTILCELRDINAHCIVTAMIEEVTFA